MGLEIAPRGYDAPYYNPERDLGLAFLRIYDANVPQGLELSNMPTWIHDTLVGDGVGLPKLQEAERRLREALDYFRDPDVDTPTQAMMRARFFESPDAAKTAVMALVGMVVTAWYFNAVREATGTPDMKLPKLLVATPMVREAIEAGLEVNGVPDDVRRAMGK